MVEVDIGVRPGFSVTYNAGAARWLRRVCDGVQFSLNRAGEACLDIIVSEAAQLIRAARRRGLTTPRASRAAPPRVEEGRRDLPGVSLR